LAWISVATLEFVAGQLIWNFYRGRHFGLTDPQIYAEVSFVVQFLITAVLAPIAPISLTIFYYDQRVRKEGYDLEKMMEAAGWMEAPAAGEIAGDAEPGNPA